MIVFDILEYILKNSKFNSQIELYIEDLFDKLSAYFPISFEPPKNNKHKITAPMLKERLNACLTGS